jgi:hypothetical protein
MAALLRNAPAPAPAFVVAAGFFAVTALPPLPQYVQYVPHLANAPLESGAFEVSQESIRAVWLAAEARAQTRAALAA